MEAEGAVNDDLVYHSKQLDASLILNWGAFAFSPSLFASVLYHFAIHHILYYILYHFAVYEKL